MSELSVPQLSCRDVAGLMASDTLHAVFDVRERGEFNDCQIANATSLPRSQIEFRIAQLVPSRPVPIILYDGGDDRATLAARTLVDLGYPRVSVLGGGLVAWKRANLPTVSGVNVPSKAFGEKIHHQRNIPEIAPEELKRLQEQAANLVILDARTPEEFSRFCIPGGVNVPGGDLILWTEELRRKTDTTVVINCAGRTRSIIGTAALRRLGLVTVRALKNGTMGWVLAGFDLESKPARKTPQAPAESRDAARLLALRLAEEERIPWISAEELLDGPPSQEGGVTYLVDVRSESEFDGGHIPGSLNVPGGQAVQRADDFIAVRKGRIVFISQEAVRAVMAAYWYRLMGFPDVRVLQGGLEEWRKRGGSIVSGEAADEPLDFESVRRSVRILPPAEVHAVMQNSKYVILDVGSSVDFAAGHVPCAMWLSRGWLEIKCPDKFPEASQTVLLSCADGRHSTFAARALGKLGYRNVFVLGGGVAAWKREGYATESGLTNCLAEPNDVVLSPSVSGNKEDMERYLQWEVELERE